MNIEALWNGPQKRLANLPKVIDRLLKVGHNLGWYDKQLSPRQLLFGLYVVYQNTRKEVKNLKQYIVYLDKRNADLHTRIVELQGYEKQVLYAGWHAVVTCYHWSCGDGCCSDSWYNYQVFNQDNVLMHETTGEHNYNMSHRCNEDIKREYGNISISYDDNYDDEN